MFGDRHFGSFSIDFKEDTAEDGVSHTMCFCNCAISEPLASESAADNAVSSPDAHCSSTDR
jgi:hypothetical protein